MRIHDRAIHLLHGNASGSHYRGIDVSFTALASLSVYVGIDILLRMEYEGSVLVAFLLVAVLSAALAALNGLFIAILELPPLIVTLGTMSVFQGILLGILNASSQNVLPEGMSKFGLASLFQVTNKKLNITSAMPHSIFLLVGIVVATWLILRHTMLEEGYTLWAVIKCGSQDGVKGKEDQIPLSIAILEYWQESRQLFASAWQDIIRPAI